MTTATPSSAREGLLPSPISEIAVAAVAVLAIGFGWAAPAYAAFGAVLVVLSRIDLATMRLPNRIIGPALAAGLPLLALATLAGIEGSSLLRAPLAAAVAFVAYLAIHLPAPGSFGLGDVKFAPLIGLHLGFLGWDNLWIGGFAAFVVYTVVISGLLAAKRIGRKEKVPFGPFMAAGAIVGLFV